MSLSWVFDGLKADPWGILPLANLSGKGTGTTTIKDYRQVCSYNWIDDPDHQTMLIPGAPSELVNWNGGRLEPDSGDMAYYENHLRYPWAPMDPLFQAIKISKENGDLKEEIDFQEFDVITDAINLQKLFAFCKGEQEGLFRIDLECIGNTIIAGRCEGADMISIDFTTFDQNLKKQCMQNYFAGPKQTSYYQIVRYQFGNLKMLVRFDPDAADYTKYNAAAAWTEDGRPPTRPVVSTDDRIPIPDSLLHYIKAGEIKKYSLVTSTSFPQGKGFPFYTWAQMFFTGMESLLIGWWKGTGDFQKPASVSLADINKLMKPLPFAILSKIHDVIGKITRFTKSLHPNARLSILWRGDDHLEIYERSPDVQAIISEPIRQYLMSLVPPEKYAEYMSEAEVINAEILEELKEEVIHNEIPEETDVNGAGEEGDKETTGELHENQDQ